jgi:hypothetical protein
MFDSKSTQVVEEVMETFTGLSDPGQVMVSGLDVMYGEQTQVQAWVISGLEPAHKVSLTCTPLAMH